MCEQIILPNPSPVNLDDTTPDALRASFRELRAKLSPAVDFEVLVAAQRIGSTTNEYTALSFANLLALIACPDDIPGGSND